MTYKGIKREATCGLTFDTRRVMRLHNDVQGESRGHTSMDMTEPKCHVLAQ